MSDSQQDQTEAVPTDGRLERYRRFAREHWKELAVFGGITAVTTCVLTLLGTHNSAVAANARAYENGRTDGLDANIRSYANGYDDCREADWLYPCDDWLYYD